MSGAGASGMMVWVIKGGCGANPVRQIASGYRNNTNSAAGYFNSEVPFNAMVFAIGQKLSTNAFAGIGSNLGGVLTQNANYVTYTGAGYGGGMIDKTTTYRSACQRRSKIGPLGGVEVDHLAPGRRTPARGTAASQPRPQEAGG